MAVGRIAARPDLEEAINFPDLFFELNQLTAGDEFSSVEEVNDVVATRE